MNSEGIRDVGSVTSNYLGFLVSLGVFALSLFFVTVSLELSDRISADGIAFQLILTLVYTAILLFTHLFALGRRRFNIGFWGVAICMLFLLWTS